MLEQGFDFGTGHTVRQKFAFAFVAPTSPVHYAGNSSVSKVFNTLILSLVHEYEFMSQLVRACMPC